MPFAAFALAAVAAAAAAQSSLPQTPPAVFGDYNHPEVSAEACKSDDPGQTTCYLPPKTMGRYLIVASGTSTAAGADAVQAIAIAGPGWVCGQVQTQKGQWTSGERTLVAQCVVTVLSDDPLKIVASFGGAGAKLSPDGVKVVIRPIAWNGVLEASNFQVGFAKPAAPAK